MLKAIGRVLAELSMIGSGSAHDSRATDIRMSLSAAALCIFTCALLLAIPVALPIGGYHWDIFMYMDGEHRIRSGQVPHTDFFSPFGPLSLFGYAVVKTVFPAAQPILAAQYATVPLAACLLAWVLISARPPRWCEVLIWACFIALALLPANFDVLPRPPRGGGTEAVGIYNRQAGLMLYVLVTALWWPVQKRSLAVILTVLLTTLFFLKVTVFVAGLLLAVLAVFAGRLQWRGLLGGIVAFALVALVTLPMLQAYLQDIFGMAQANGQSGREMARRIFETLQTSVGLYFLLLVTTCALLLTELGWGSRLHAERAVMRGSTIPFALLSLLGLFIESQNTGSHTLAFVVPAALRVVSLAERDQGAGLSRHLLLVGATGFCIVVGVQLIQGYARLATGILRQPMVTELQKWDMYLRGLPEDISRARAQLVLHNENPGYQEHAAKLGLDTGMTYLPQTQIANLLALVEAADAIRALQAKGERIVTVATLDFADPISSLLGTAPIRGLPIAFDPGRTASRSQLARTMEAWSTADALLAPQCPTLWNRQLQLELAAPLLRDRRRQRLTACWTIYLRRPS